MKNIRTKTFEDAFIGIIQSIHIKPDEICESRNGNMYEQLSIGYTVEDPTSFKFLNEQLGRIPYDYAQDFYYWMMNGSNEADTSILAEKYPQIAGFLEKPKSDVLPSNFNSFYGARIKDQLDPIIKELKGKENSRRCVISILQPQDIALLDENADSNLEYPCCDGITLSIRTGHLHAHVHMRSNNMANVAKLDMYLWGRFQTELAQRLNVKLGYFNCSIVSAHIFENDFTYLENLGILNLENE